MSLENDSLRDSTWRVSRPRFSFSDSDDDDDDDDDDSDNDLSVHLWREKRRQIKENVRPTGTQTRRCVKSSMAAIQRQYDCHGRL